MRKRKCEKSAYIVRLLMLGAFALAFQLGVVGALAQVQCDTSVDTDCDGFPNTVENSGFSLLPTGMTGMYLAATNATTMPNCTISTLPRGQCVDAASQDLFVIIQRANGVCPASSCGTGYPCAPSSGTSDIPLPPYDNTYSNNNTIYHIDPLGLILPGLGVTTHELYQTSGTSQVIGSQLLSGTPPTGWTGWKAVKIVEELLPCSSVMGLTVPGVPTSGSILGKVYPEYIKNWVQNTCTAACFVDSKGVKTCYTPTTPGVTSFMCTNYNSQVKKTVTTVNMQSPDAMMVAKLNAEFIQNVVSHETSHMMHLAWGSGTTADHHWPIAYGYLMEQSIGTKVTKGTKGNITVNLYISTGYYTPDKGQHLLE